MFPGTLIIPVLDKPGSVCLPGLYKIMIFAATIVYIRELTYIRLS